MQDCQVTTHAKWIVCGEHTVVRGGAALAFPLDAFQLQLIYSASDQETAANFSGISEIGADESFWRALQVAHEICGKTIAEGTGIFHIDNHIPIGMGLGASAALSVAIGRWCLQQGWISADELYQFSHQLENLFHGESSGVDIAAVIADTGIVFANGSVVRTITRTWQPFWYLCPTDRVGNTADCVARVMQLAATEPAAAMQADDNMQHSVAMAEVALLAETEAAVSQLAAAIELANQCFLRWGLVDIETQKLMSRLTAAGAMAVKPTGSGGGGYLLTIWAQPPIDTTIQDYGLVALS